MLKDIHPLFEAMPISKSLNFKIQIFWNNSVATATHDASVWTGQSSQFRAYNGTLPRMLNNVSDGFNGATAGTVRASVYVMILVMTQHKKLSRVYQQVALASKWNYTFKRFKCFLTLKAIMLKII